MRGETELMQTVLNSAPTQASHSAYLLQDGLRFSAELVGFSDWDRDRRCKDR